MIDLYYHYGPNPTKVVLLLEEVGLRYRAIPVDILRGEQFEPGITALNPNAKVPVIVDEGVTVFDSNAILLYLAEKTGRFLSTASRGELLSWLMMIASGVGPFCGQAVHFRHFANDVSDYAARRFQFEAKRHYEVLNNRLRNSEWLVGNDYSIVDMDAWAWTRNMEFVVGEGARAEFPALARFVDAISARPAAKIAAALRTRDAFTQAYDPNAHLNMYRHGGTRAA